MRLIDADALGNRMYHESFEKDSDLQRWDGGCWIRYKLFEQVLRAAPTIDPQTHSNTPNTLGALESIQTTQLTDEDKETIRIHLNAFKESLCNQGRWYEATEYEELIHRLLSTSSVQPELSSNSQELDNKNGELISRQETVDEIDEWIIAFRVNGYKDSAADACLIRDGIIQLPSVPRKGKWTRHFDGNEWYWYCSSCKEQWYEEDLWMGGNSFPNFCPNCGCCMEGGDSDDN